MDATGAREERKITAHTEALVERLPDAEQPIVDLLSKLNEFAVSAGESTRLLIDGDQFFPALAERIDQARHHVHI
jgi:cardiolipin synthase